MELNFGEETTDSSDRMSTGEGPSSVPGAGLEYDLWEGQFQFVGQPSSPPAQRCCDRPLTRRRSSRLSEQVRVRPPPARVAGILLF